MARKGKGKPERFIKKFKTGATVVFTQQSKHYLTCETSTESTNRPRQITNKKNCSSPEMTESFLYLVDLKPLTTIIPPLCLLTVPRPSVFTASSSLLFSFYRRITVMNTGTAHRSCQCSRQCIIQWRHRTVYSPWTPWETKPRTCTKRYAKVS